VVVAADGPRRPVHQRPRGAGATGRDHGSTTPPERTPVGEPCWSERRGPRPRQRPVRAEQRGASCAPPGAALVSPPCSASRR
jgi:hypothetical protein